MLRRYIHGQGADETLIWLERNVGGSYDKRFFYTDQQGSITAVTDSTGTVKSIMSYDSYGVPTTVSTATDSNMDPAYDSPFRYTGQYYLKGLGLYYYKARLYSPTLRRFLQTDPIGYGDGMNWYGYVHGDPINGSDPSGLCYNDENGNNHCDYTGAPGFDSGNFLGGGRGNGGGAYSVTMTYQDGHTWHFNSNSSFWSDVLAGSDYFSGIITLAGGSDGEFLGGYGGGGTGGSLFGGLFNAPKQALHYMTLVGGARDK